MYLHLELPLPSQGVKERFSVLSKSEVILPVHVEIVLKLSVLPDDMGHAMGFRVNNFGFLELDNKFLIESMLWHFQLIYLSKAALPLVLLRPILNRPIGLPTVGLLTLAENAVNHNLQFQVILHRL